MSGISSVRYVSKLLFTNLTHAPFQTVHFSRSSLHHARASATASSRDICKLLLIANPNLVSSARMGSTSDAIRTRVGDASESTEKPIVEVQEEAKVV